MSKREVAEKIEDKSRTETTIDNLWSFVNLHLSSYLSGIVTILVVIACTCGCMCMVHTYRKRMRFEKRYTRRYSMQVPMNELPHQMSHQMTHFTPIPQSLNQLQYIREGNHDNRSQRRLTDINISGPSISPLVVERASQVP